MFPFSFSKATDERSAFAAAASGARYIAGGTTLVDLMRETVERPAAVVDINGLPHRSIDLQSSKLRIGSLVRMSELAANLDVRREFPVIAQALESSASAQLRNMASIGGNLMQRPRCLYFRDVTANCNRRTPGSGCAAASGLNRGHAILGTSEHCVAAHPSDLAVALVALGAVVIARHSGGERQIPIAQFFRRPGSTPDREHDLRPGELIVAVEVPAGPEMRRSGYLKVRDRESFEFALTSAAVALDIDAGVIRTARVAVGGVATVPWRLPAVERALQGQAPDPRLWSDAAALAADGAKPLSQNGFKVDEAYGRASARDRSGAAMTRPVRASKAVVGQPVVRVDGPLKVTGQARYAADNQFPNLVHAVLVCSTVARGSVERIDARTALADPDVLRVLTDFSGVKLAFDPQRVAFFGQPVAIVVASTLEAAVHGASLVDVRYASEPPLTDIDAPEAVKATAPETPDYARGDADAALRRAAVVTDLRYTIARNHHNPMELPSTIARWDGDQLTIWDKVQGITAAQAAVAGACGIPAANVRVLSPFVGGAFGSAGRTWPHQILAAFAARQMQRPVKLVVTRKQMYSGIGYRPTSRQRLAIGADRSGRITAAIHEGHTETARYQLYEEGLTGLPRSLYSSPNMRSTYRVVALDVNVPTFMRGPGESSGAFALESAMDDLAHQLGMDPIELRVRNEPDRDQETGKPFSTRRLTDCLNQGAASFGWSQRNPVPRSVREGDQLIGMGMAAAAYHAVRNECQALARVNADGTADVQSGTIDMGAGTYTSMTQVAADALGIPMRRIRFTLGDSRLPKAPMHSGSKTMASVGSAVYTASNMLRDNFIRIAVVDPASPLNGTRPEDVSVADGRMFRTDDPARSETYQDLLRRRGWPSLDSQQTWSPGDTNSRFALYAYGAVFAEVAVDELLGTARIRRIFGCYDGGRIVNPKLAHSQAIGGMVAGIGMTLLEGTQVDHRDGRVVNANMSDYLVPVNADVPALDATFLAAEDTIADPIGVKGLGEIVIVGVPAAIGNAVFNATGKRITDLPITLDRLF